MDKEKLAIVVPCYNEDEVLPDTIKSLSNLLEQMILQGQIAEDSFMLFVNDGSKDHTWEIIERCHQSDSRVCGVNLAGNVGHQNALMAGLIVAKDLCDIAISIDADLQDDIHVIPEMVDNYKKGFDIVYGVRKERNSDTFFKRNTALFFYKLMAYLGVKSVYNHADFRLMSKRAINQLENFRERNLYLRGMVPLIGYKTTSVYYNRSARLAGESKYPISKMVNFAIDGITSFSVKPVRYVFFLGVFFLLVALVIFCYTIHAYFTGKAIPGWTSLILSIWFSSGCILIGLGVIGEYIGKIYIEVKDRPRYNIERVLI